MHVFLIFSSDPACCSILERLRASLQCGLQFMSFCRAAICSCRESTNSKTDTLSIGHKTSHIGLLHVMLLTALLEHTIKSRFRYTANGSAPCVFRRPWQGTLRCCHGCTRAALRPELLPGELPQQSAFFRGGCMRLSRSLGDGEAMRDSPQAGQTADHLHSQKDIHHKMPQP